MNSKIRTTLTAAALAALTVIAPNALAQERGRGGPRDNGNQPRQENRGGGGERRGGGNYGFRGGEGRGYGNYGHGYGNYGHGYGNYGHGYGNYGHGYGYRSFAPRPAYGYGYGHLPYRVYSGTRFFTAYPGPGYVYIGGFGWVLPPFFGAVWVPGHYDIDGFWIEGFWR